MCGIVGYIGKKNAVPFLLQGLEKLEYRGYDSSGIAINLENKISGKTLNVSTHAEILTHENGGQYIRLHIARGTSSASTTSGKYFIRVSDNSVPLTGDDITRLSAEKGYYR